MPYRHDFVELRDTVRDMRPAVRGAVCELAARANARPQQTVQGTQRKAPALMTQPGARDTRSRPHA